MFTNCSKENSEVIICYIYDSMLCFYKKIRSYFTITKTYIQVILSTADETCKHKYIPM